MLTVTAAHIPVTAEHLSEAPYIGWSFVALEVGTAVLAVVLVLRGDRLVWSAAGGVAALAIAAYVLTRSVALPQIADDVGNWSEPLGIVALSAEKLLLTLVVAHRSPLLRRPRLTAHPVALACTVLALGLVSTAYATGREPADGSGDGTGHGHSVAMMASTLPPLRWDSFGDNWHVRPWWFLFAWLVTSTYAAAIVVARRHGVPTVHPVRVLSFVAGIVLLLITVSSAIDTYAMAIFWDHMIEHLLLIMVIPVLLVLGHPLSALRAAASTYGNEAAVDAFTWSRPVAVLTHPIVALGLYAVVIAGTHLTDFMDAMAQHSWLMGAEQWLYLLTGYLYFLPLLGAEPIRWQLPYLARPALILFGMTPDTVVGIVLLQTTHNLFPIMEAVRPSWAPSPVDDLHVAGALMWVAGDGLMMLFGVGVVIAIISHSRSEQMIGQRLESIRRRTLTQHLTSPDGTAALADDIDVDNDEAMLDAYNQMLARMNAHSTPPTSNDGGPPTEARESHPDSPAPRHRPEPRAAGEPRSRRLARGRARSSTMSTET